MPTHAEIVSYLDPTLGQDVLTLGNVPIPVADLRTDFEDFRRQEQFLTGFTGVWPSVQVDLPDPSSTGNKIRAVPINVFGTAQKPYGREAATQFMINLESSLSGLPVDFVKPQEARQNFYDGLADVILGRVAWFAGKKSTANPKVTVSGTPAGNQVQFTKGHFFWDSDGLSGFE
jgi:hypothetical protein